MTARTLLRRLALVVVLAATAFTGACGSDDDDDDGANVGGASGADSGTGGFRYPSSSSSGGSDGGTEGGLTAGRGPNGSAGTDTTRGTAGSSTTGESTCVRGVQTGDACNPDIDTDPCVRSTQTCECQADGSWECTPTQDGTAGAGSTAGESTCVRGVQTGDACNPDIDTDPCVRGTRTCECQADETWECTPTQDVTGSAGAGSTAGESTCVRGVQTGDACNPDIDTDPCVRSTRTCECQADETWLCTPTQDGTGGAGPTGTAGAGPTGTAGSTGESTCVRGVQTGDDCNPDIDTDPCVRGTRTCECQADETWLCTPTGGGSAGAPGTAGAGGSPQPQGGAGGLPQPQGGAGGSPQPQGGAGGSPQPEGGAGGSPAEGGAGGVAGSTAGAGGSTG